MSPAAPVTLEELYAEFEELGDWDAQCDYLIDLGHELPKLPESAKTEANRVHGCQSNVWLIAEPRAEDERAEDERAEDGPVIEFVANSDAIIVNGLIAVLMAMYNGRSARAILDIDPRAIFTRLGLERQLSPQRRNGLFGMVERIRRIATEAVSREGGHS